MDNEAGLEHISRHTTSNIDALIVVVTENPISLITAKSIKKITSNLKTGILRKCIVSNTVRDNRLALLRERIKELEMEYVGNIPYDPQLEELIFRGRTLRDLNNSSARRSIEEIINRLE